MTKKFWIRTFLFLLLPIAGCIFILLTPLERKYALRSLPTDCLGRGPWLYNRLYEDSLPADVAFIGTSHTINSILDTLISSRLSANGTRTTALNMGYCRFGSDMAVTLLRDLVAAKHPKTVVLEIEQDLSTTSHPVFPYYANTNDLVHPASLVQLSYPSDVYEGFLARLGQLREHIFNVPHVDSSNFSSSGYLGNPEKADPALLKEPSKLPEDRAGWFRNLQTRYPRAWIQLFADICRENHIRVYLLYIPSYHDQPVPTEGFPFYNSIGKVLLPPAELLHNKELWRDADHLNDRGALLFSEWISGQIVE